MVGGREPSGPMDPMDPLIGAYAKIFSQSWNEIWLIFIDPSIRLSIDLLLLLL